MQIFQVNFFSNSHFFVIGLKILYICKDIFAKQFSRGGYLKESVYWWRFTLKIKYLKYCKLVWGRLIIDLK